MRREDGVVGAQVDAGVAQSVKDVTLAQTAFSTAYIAPVGPMGPGI